jgi:DNA-binding beta-propeller fold protein YncE
LPGAPDGSAATADGRFAFAALQSGPARIAVMERTGAGARLLRTIPVPAYASGTRVTPDGRHLVAAAGRGAIVLDVAAAISGTGPPVVGLLSAPSRVPGSGPGAAEVAVSPDSRRVFVTIEAAGVVAVFDLHRGIGPRAFVGAVHVGAGALGIAASPHGRWLYEVSESARAGSSPRRGVLNVIDVARAIRGSHWAVVAAAPVPCAPVRVAVSPDGATVWVTVRDANALLGFAAAALRRTPARALASTTAVGKNPLGVAVANSGRTMLVADSNLSGSPGARAGISVVNTASPAHPVLIGTIPAGKLPDAIATPPAGGAYVTISDSRQVDVLAPDRIP